MTAAEEMDEVLENLDSIFDLIMVDDYICVCPCHRYGESCCDDCEES